MFSYFNVGTCVTFKFKLAVGTEYTKQRTCSVICDPFQTTKFKGYRWVLSYVGAGHLIHYVQVILPFSVIGQRVGKISYTSKKVS